MAAGEEQPQAVVGDRGHVGLGGCGVGRGQRDELPQLVPVAAVAPQAIDRAVACGGQDPGTGVVGQPVAGPALNGLYEGFLNRVLGQVDIAEDANEGGDRPPRLPPEQAVDGLLGRPYDRASTPLSLLCSSDPAAL